MLASIISLQEMARYSVCSILPKCALNSKLHLYKKRCLSREVQNAKKKHHTSFAIE